MSIWILAFFLIVVTIMVLEAHFMIESEKKRMKIQDAEIQEVLNDLAKAVQDLKGELVK